MSEESDILNESNDVDLSSVDTNFPILPKSTYKFLVADCKVVPGKSREGSFVLETKLTLNEQVTAVSGRVLSPGFPLTHRIGLTPTEKYTATRIKESLAQFLDGVIGESARKREGRLQPVDRFIGQEVAANITISNDAVYGERNEISRLLKKA